ncbi:unnamed protein product, partial [Anisakis simplex]|uniref:PAX3-and PAX7-binding protein 1 n=1 Tax=Anisakis simplex TaxID=6269 RepID=A0A0M3JDS6_ANISI
VAVWNRAEVDDSENTTREQRDWDDIIPEEERKRVEEEEREKAEKDLFLGPRQRTKIPQQMADEDDESDEGAGGGAGGKKRRKHRQSDGEDDDSEDDKRRRGGGSNASRKKLLFGFTDVEIRKFVKSFRKFANPLTRCVYFLLHLIHL